MNNNYICGVCHYVALTAKEFYSHVQRRRCVPSATAVNNVDTESSYLSPMDQTMDDITVDDVDMAEDVEMVKNDNHFNESNAIYIIK